MMSKPVTWYPAFISRVAMGVPMRPRPMTETFFISMMVLYSLTGRCLRLDFYIPGKVRFFFSLSLSLNLNLVLLDLQVHRFSCAS
jgi:hypothetical protein